MTHDVPAAADFRRDKFALALRIMIAGMCIAAIWDAVQGWVLGRGYPYDTFLFKPEFAFSDLSDVTLDASRANPFVDPTAVYLPFAWVVLRPLHALPSAVAMIGFAFIALAALYLLLLKALERVVPQTPPRVASALLLLAFAYPVLYCLDRGNIELIIAPAIAAAVYFTARTRYGLALMCLVPAICLKIYPAVFLVLLVRQRKWSLALCGVLASVFLTLLSLRVLDLPIQVAWSAFHRDVVYFTQNYIYENSSLEGAASPWNAWKLDMISLANLRVIAPIDFSYDNSFVMHAYAVYSAGMSLLALGVVIYLLVMEKEFLRGAMALLLFLSISAPSGGDYRLLYAGIALVLLIALKTKRARDWIILVLLALVMVPKKEILFEYAGRTESAFRDVSIQVVLNPLFILVALFLLFDDARREMDWRWTRQRLVNFASCLRRR